MCRKYFICYKYILLIIFTTKVTLSPNSNLNLKRTNLTLIHRLGTATTPLASFIPVSTYDRGVHPHAFKSLASIASSSCKLACDGRSCNSIFSSLTISATSSGTTGSSSSGGGPTKLFTKKRLVLSSSLGSIISALPHPRFPTTFRGIRTMQTRSIIDSKGMHPKE